MRHFPPALPDRLDGVLVTVVGTAVWDLPMPVLTIRESALEHNLGAMSAYCADHEVELAPHCKTHMSPELWHRQQSHGARTATVATARQAEVLVQAGATSILIANQVVASGDLELVNRIRRAGVDVMLFVDSRESLSALHSGLERGLPPVGVLAEYGLTGYRTGCRSWSELAEVAAESRRSDVVRLRGMSGYEGVLGSGAGPAPDELLHTYLEHSTRMFERLLGEYDDDAPFIASFGGSDLYPAVIEAFAHLAPDPRARLVLRSGCYLVHDHGKYARAQASTASCVGVPRFLPALEVWAPIVSTPEAGLAVLGLGKRHVSNDVDYPVPLTVQRDGEVTGARGIRVTSLYDQHAVLSLAEQVDLRVGDLMAVGISHPCTTFDKWRTASVVNDRYEVVERIHTTFI